MLISWIKAYKNVVELLVDTGYQRRVLLILAEDEFMKCSLMHRETSGYWTEAYQNTTLTLDAKNKWSSSSITHWFYSEHSAVKHFYTPFILNSAVTGPNTSTNSIWRKLFLNVNILLLNFVQYPKPFIFALQSPHG